VTQTYQDFLRSKMVHAEDRGIVVSPDELNPKLFPHQRACHAAEREIESPTLFDLTEEEVEA
jgi:hypothetical protein